MSAERKRGPRPRGRPPRVFGRAASERVWFYCTPEEKAALEQAADGDNATSLGEWVRDVVNDAVAERGEDPIFRTTDNSRSGVA